LRLVVALVVVRIDDGAGAVRGCKWGSGEAAVPQPGTWTNATTCTPPSIVGAGEVTLTDLSGADGATQTTGTATTELDYLDVQVYRYPHVDPAASSAYRTGNTTVALIAHGADGCTACGGSPLCTKMTPAEWSVCLTLHVMRMLSVELCPCMSAPPAPVSPPSRGRPTLRTPLHHSRTYCFPRS
jgi:hypothetical protein